MGFLWFGKKKTAAAPAPAPVAPAPAWEPERTRTQPSTWAAPAYQAAPVSSPAPSLTARDAAVAGRLEAADAQLRGGWGTEALNTFQRSIATQILGAAYDAGFALARDKAQVVEELAGSVRRQLPSLADYNREVLNFLGAAFEDGASARMRARSTAY